MNSITKSSVGILQIQDIQKNIKEPPACSQNISKVLTINGKLLDQDASLDLAELFPPEALGAENKINETSWTCKHCSKTSYSISDYAKHLKTHFKLKSKSVDGDNQKIECDICSKKVAQMYRHLQQHTGEFACHLCLMNHSRKTYLTNHQKTCKDGDGIILQCVICKLIVETRNELREHLIKSHCEPPDIKNDVVVGNGGCDNKNPSIFPCSYCKRSYSRRSLLSRHVRTKHNIYGLNADEECLICHVKFNSVRTALRHKQIHEKGKLFKCSECDQSFLDASVLKTHQLKHDLGSYTCPYCDAVVRYIQSLKRHITQLHKSKIHEMMFLNFEELKCTLPLKKYKKTKQTQQQNTSFTPIQSKELLLIEEPLVDTNVLEDAGDNFIYDDNLLNLVIDYPIELLCTEDLSQFSVEERGGEILNAETTVDAGCDFYVDTNTGQLVVFEKT
ncbi:zinc finger protein Xfin-like [Ctenocephalides felis]|uniref:zinc finger protein Xfin-like n=1 Tax=Ctenocephalides felis TaxID=7515 RepID=UPI000E6E136A|nr:zinc finger protein Xfin-like [Ctenocephalides felis]XP_026481207.1 zinc finger protein Xfin-like [Ctenocephalides felis]